MPNNKIKKLNEKKNIFYIHTEQRAKSRKRVEMDFYEEEVYEKYCEHTSAIALHFFSESLIIFSIIILDTRAVCRFSLDLCCFCYLELLM